MIALADLLSREVLIIVWLAWDWLVGCSCQ